MTRKNNNRWNVPSNLRGRWTECRVVSSIVDPNKFRPPWFKSVRFASQDENNEGFDIFVELDVGIVPVQIKSNPKHISRWKKTHPEKLEAVVLMVVPTYRNCNWIREKVYGRLWERRMKIMLQTRCAEGGIL